MHTLPTNELLNRKLLLRIDELIYVADCRRMDYNLYRPQSKLDYMALTAYAAIYLFRNTYMQE
jgi:hypothetical protein